MGKNQTHPFQPLPTFSTQVLPSTIAFLTTPDIRRRHAELVSLYQAAFRPPPYHKTHPEIDDFSRSLPEHITHPGFRLAAGFAGPPPSSNTTLLGFAYGYDPSPGRLWLALVSRALGPDTAAWLPGSFHLAELLVHPAAQNQGLGSQLHDFLLHGRPHPRALLTTMAGQTPAIRFYERKGWLRLGRLIRPPAVSRTYQTMGRFLNRRSPRL